MRHVKLFEEFEAYNEFGLENEDNVKKTIAALDDAKIEYDLTAGGGITFFVFPNAGALNSAVEIANSVIDKAVEPEWE